MNQCNKDHARIWYECEKCPLCIVHENIRQLIEKLIKETEGE